MPTDLFGVWLPTSQPLETLLARMLMAAGLGAVIGFERERRHTAAGLRTHMLVALAACVFTLLMLEVAGAAAFDDDQISVDPARIIEAVTAGVAFLAAGAIIRFQGQIRGVTTGAGLWLAGALGTAVGLGYGVIAVLGAAIGLVIIIVLRWIEPPIQRRGRKRAPADPPPDDPA